ncbi:hypothetical protein BDB01DRAFT_895998 [Pilobolus umbonatus]|nr:hypothetical protein BDB01DRAFT_895998 [Pilobolus umbonatus]
MSRVSSSIKTIDLQLWAPLLTDTDSFTHDLLSQLVSNKTELPEVDTITEKGSLAEYDETDGPDTRLNHFPSDYHLSIHQTNDLTSTSFYSLMETDKMSSAISSHRSCRVRISYDSNLSDIFNAAGMSTEDAEWKEELMKFSSRDQDSPSSSDATLVVPDTESVCSKEHVLEKLSSMTDVSMAGEGVSPTGPLPLLQTGDNKNIIEKSSTFLTQKIKRIVTTRDNETVQLNEMKTSLRGSFNSTGQLTQMKNTLRSSYNQSSPLRGSHNPSDYSTRGSYNQTDLRGSYNSIGNNLWGNRNSSGQSTQTKDASRGSYNQSSPNVKFKSKVTVNKNTDRKSNKKLHWWQNLFSCD